MVLLNEDVPAWLRLVNREVERIICRAYLAPHHPGRREVVPQDRVHRVDLDGHLKHLARPLVVLQVEVREAQRVREVRRGLPQAGVAAQVPLQGPGTLPVLLRADQREAQVVQQHRAGHGVPHGRQAPVVGVPAQEVQRTSEKLRRLPAVRYRQPFPALGPQLMDSQGRVGHGRVRRHRLGGDDGQARANPGLQDLPRQPLVARRIRRDC
mmetsp:Transcript_100223/g.283780  ORF Transcript_100223/g.283780 Transcript_100223/m.283780 type:complete len:210 (-) Transcript_100223:613-1242(-)